MRRTLFPSLIIIFTVVAVAATAIAAETQNNTYTVKGSIKGAKGATKKKPKPVELNFDYNVGEEHGLRPSPITKYSIFFANGQVNTKAFTGCDIKKLNAASNSKGVGICPKKSIMGSGKVIAEVGQPDNPADKSLYCYLDLTTVNGKKKNQFLLYLKGVQTGRPKDKLCVTAIAQAIDAKFVKKPGGTALQFTVPSNLLHPAGLDNGVTTVTSKVNKVSRKVKGKRVGFFEATKCPKKSLIKVDFTQESDGATKTASTTTACK